MRLSTIVFGFFALVTSPAFAFCGFYVAKADGALFNKASKVVYVRDGRKSVITMGSDYRGAAKDFALIVPTPKVLKREQIKTVKGKTVDHLDAYTAPRLVEYFHPDPCKFEGEPFVVEEVSRTLRKQKVERRRGAAALGVKIKGEYAVGDYDILMLSATQSDGLVTFLKQEGYRLPPGAEAPLGQYIKGGMKFFVAKVNLKRHAANKAQELPPLQISFKSRDFMLPIQLGKLNGDGRQDALIYMLTRKGRVETTNYQTKKLPTDFDIPVFVEDVFGDFYTRVFERTIGSRGGIVMEYAWDMAWCDPCAADPLSSAELKELGVDWLKGNKRNAGQDVFVTRLHAQYGPNDLPKDLQFRVTNDRNNFQGRYVMNHPFDGKITCDYGKDYVKSTRLRLREEVVNLSKQTGWAPRKIEARVRKTVPQQYW